MDKKYIKFDDFHVEKILTGEKWLTVRYDWDENLVSGEKVDLVDSEGVQFAEGVIQFTTRMTIAEFVDCDFIGHRQYLHAPELCSVLENYYPNADLSPSTEITLISFRLLDENGRPTKGFDKEKINSMSNRVNIET